MHTDTSQVATDRTTGEWRHNSKVEKAAIRQPREEPISSGSAKYQIDPPSLRENRTNERMKNSGKAQV